VSIIENFIKGVYNCFVMIRETPIWALPLLFFILGAIVAMLFVLIYSFL